MAKRMRRNGGEWRVLLASAGWGVWDPNMPECGAIPVASEAEAFAAARRLVIEGEAKLAFVVDPDGLYRGQASSSDPARGYDSDGYGHEFVAHGYGLSTRLLESALAREMTGDTEVRLFVDRASMHAVREWRAARREDRMPSPVSEYAVALAAIAARWANIRESVPGFVAIGLRRSLVLRPGGADAEPSELGAIGLLVPRRGALWSHHVSNLTAEGLHMLPQGEAEYLWRRMTDDAFRHIVPTPGFE